MKIPIDIKFLRWRVIGWLVLTAYPRRSAALVELRYIARKNSRHGFPNYATHPRLALIKAARDRYPNLSLSQAAAYIDLLLANEE